MAAICVIVKIICLVYISLPVQCTERKHVLFLLVDDLRASVLPAYGGQAIVPNFDRLTSGGVLFENAYAQQALCGPSRTSLLTSRRPDTLELFDNSHHYFRERNGTNFTTLPQYFRENGYVTASFGKVFHPGKISGHDDDYAYSWSRKPFHGSTEQFKNSPVCGNDEQHLGANLVCPVDVNKQPMQTLPDIEATRAAIDFISDHSKNSEMDRKLFIAIGFNKPHIPLKYPAHFLDLYAEVDVAQHREYPPFAGLLAWNPWMDIRLRDDVNALNLTSPFAYIPDHFQKSIIKSYLAATSYVDSLFGLVMSQLEVTGLLDSTNVVMTSDHGWQLGEHGEWGKYSNFEAALKVPLIISTPETRERGGSRVRDAAELLDIFPTITELAGIGSIEKCPFSPPALSLCTEGKSLIAGNGRYVFSQCPRPSVKPQGNSDQPKMADIKYMGYSVKDTKSRSRYTEWLPFQAMNPNWNEPVDRELYLDDDETFNHAFTAKYYSQVEHLSKILRDKHQR
ncbi:Iduronate 2-sulfatase [Halotydeus destructor]|nr:Iduronate 2-sulfatase [Halotydeus destructor]